MFKKNDVVVVILIFALAFFLRIIFISTTPPLLWDEAALGYNAYSIITTGRDEFGKFLPIIFKSFGDYKPGLYVYLAIPFIKLLGLTEISVRLPSIILGSLIPVVGYFLVKRQLKDSSLFAILFALSLAINPFNIHFSRGAWETNVLTFELLLASYLFFSKKYFFSSVIFGLTLYTYQSGKLISILLISILFILNFRELFRNYSTVLIRFILPLFIFSLPIAYGLVFGSDSNRLKVVSLFSYPRSDSETAQILSESNPTDYQIFHSQPIFFSRNFISRYFNHFSPRFLFFEGDWQNPRHSAPYIGVLLYPCIVLLPLGFFIVLSKRHRPLLDNYMLTWLLLAPIPAALTRDSVQSTRAMSLSIPLIYFASFGLTFIINNLPQQKLLRQAALWLIFATYLLSFVYYEDLYFNHMVKRSPNDFLYGYRPAVEYVVKNGTGKQIFFTDFYGQPYIYYLFYSQYSPFKYQQLNHYQASGVDTGKVEFLDSIKFATPQLNELLSKKNILAIFSWDEILRQGINTQPIFARFVPLSPINHASTFYAFEN